MKILNDETELKKALEEISLDKKFDLSNLKIRLLEYEKGEFLSGPDISQTYLLFVVSGTAQIYGISTDGRKIPANIAKKGTVIGDVEYCQHKNSLLYVEATSKIRCLGIHFRDNKKYLDNNIDFLHFMLKTISQKVYMSKSMWDSPAVSVEEKLLEYMQNECENNTLAGVEQATLVLQCSRRQLQRVLTTLCEEGRIVKVKKGVYSLVG